MGPQPMTRMKPPPLMLFFYSTLKGLDEKSKIKINCVRHMLGEMSLQRRRKTENCYIFTKSGLELGDEQTDGLWKTLPQTFKASGLLVLLVFTLRNSLHTSCSVMLLFFFFFLISPAGGAGGYWITRVTL